MRAHRPIVATALALAGCSATVVDEGEAVDISSQGAVSVERIVTVASEPAVRSRVSARFLRVRGPLDLDDAAGLVGATSETPIAPGCVWLEPSAAAPPAQPQARVELLDVGDVVLHHDQRSGDELRSADGRGAPAPLRLAARAFPDVGDVVSGVIYTSRDDSADVPVGGRYRIETSGSPWLDSFAAEVDAPAAPSGVRVAGRDLDEPQLEEMTLALGEPLFVAWDAASSAEGSSAEGSSAAESADSVFVEVRPLDGSGALRCAFADAGEAEIPGALLSASLRPGAVELALHRHRRASLPAALAVGLQEAIVDFDFAVGVRATLVQP